MLRARTPTEFTELLRVPRDLPMPQCVSAGALGYVKHIWPRSSFLYAAVLSENGYSRSFNLKLSVDGDYAASTLLFFLLLFVVINTAATEGVGPRSVWITAVHICIMPVIMG